MKKIKCSIDKNKCHFIIHFDCHNKAKKSAHRLTLQEQQQSNVSARYVSDIFQRLSVLFPQQVLEDDVVMRHRRAQFDESNDCCQATIFKRIVNY